MTVIKFIKSLFSKEPRGNSIKNSNKSHIKSRGDNNTFNLYQDNDANSRNENMKQERIEDWRGRVIRFSGYSYVKFEGESGEYCASCFDNNDERITMRYLTNDEKMYLMRLSTDKELICLKCKNISKKKHLLATFRL
ncbi:MAG: hypothetical protein FWC13_01860 [Oscillospiraceae bacterium]|nr:hypothetical protein [Oscillospiraceae bacterium]